MMNYEVTNRPKLGKIGSRSNIIPDFICDRVEVEDINIGILSMNWSSDARQGSPVTQYDVR